MNRFKIDNRKKVTDNTRPVLGRDAANAFLADQCVRLALAAWGDAAESKPIAEEILRGLHALPKSRRPEPLTAEEQHERHLNMVRAAIASPKTPEHLKAGLLRRYPELR